MLEVLIYMFQNYFGAQTPASDTTIEQDYIAQELSEAGFNSNDIAGAFDWYNQLRDLISQPYYQYLSNPTSIRIFTETERERIDTESFSFLSFVERAGVILPNERDLIIDRAMALKQQEITIEEIRWITMMVLWNDNRKKDYLFVEDAVFNPKGLTLQ
jgi:Smg protein